MRVPCYKKNTLHISINKIKSVYIHVYIYLKESMPDTFCASCLLLRILIFALYVTKLRAIWCFTIGKRPESPFEIIVWTYYLIIIEINNDSIVIKQL